MLINLRGKGNKIILFKGKFDYMTLCFSSLTMIKKTLEEKNQTMASHDGRPEQSTVLIPMELVWDELDKRLKAK